MNFTDKEKQGCSEILRQLPCDTVLSLADTVTKKTVTVQTLTEAIDAILLFSAGVSELLNRKKITKDHLMQYVFSEKISLLGSSDKQVVIKQLVQYWADTSAAAAGRDLLNNNKVEKRNNKNNIVLPHTGGEPSTPHIVPQQQEITSGDVGQFGRNFASWFYQMLNSKTETSLSPSHFWPNATAHLLFKSSNEHKESIQGAEAAAYKLKRLVMEEKLHFNANIDAGGVVCQVESCGIVGVMVQGTVHKLDCCIGVFEQAFTMIREPSANTWKINCVKLKICCQ
ncbi:uncharacterized protein C3orf38 homolog [Argonauta hians]